MGRSDAHLGEQSFHLFGRNLDAALSSRSALEVVDGNRDSAKHEIATIG